MLFAIRGAARTAWSLLWNGLHRQDHAARLRTNAVTSQTPVSAHTKGSHRSDGPASPLIRQMTSFPPNSPHPSSRNRQSHRQAALRRTPAFYRQSGAVVSSSGLHRCSIPNTKITLTTKLLECLQGNLQDQGLCLLSNLPLHYRVLAKAPVFALTSDQHSSAV